MHKAFSVKWGEVEGEEYSGEVGIFFGKVRGRARARSNLGKEVELLERKEGRLGRGG